MTILTNCVMSTALNEHFVVNCFESAVNLKLVGEVLFHLKFALKVAHPLPLKKR